MAFAKKQALRATLFALIFGASAAVANAQFATFDLPFEAHWGRAVLEPGHYRIDAPRSPAWPQVLYLMGPHKLYTIFATAERPDDPPEKSFLKVLNYGNDHYVSDFAWRERGRHFTFSKPHIRAEVMAKADHPQESIVPVAAP